MGTGLKPTLSVESDRMVVERIDDQNSDSDLVADATHPIDGQP